MQFLKEHKDPISFDHLLQEGTFHSKSQVESSISNCRIPVHAKINIILKYHTVFVILAWSLKWAFFQGI